MPAEDNNCKPSDNSCKPSEEIRRTTSQTIPTISEVATIKAGGHEPYRYINSWGIADEESWGRPWTWSAWIWKTALVMASSWVWGTIALPHNISHPDIKRECEQPIIRPLQSRVPNRAGALNRQQMMPDVRAIPNVGVGNQLKNSMRRGVWEGIIYHISKDVSTKKVTS